MTSITRTTTTSRPALRGALTALVTPFTPDGGLDEIAFRRLVRWQVLAGIDGVVPCGTTGEAPTLSDDERDRLIAATVETVAERPSRARVAVVAGTGTNDTAATIRSTRRAAALGADAALVVAPYYNRPDGRMLEAHFRAVADEGVAGDDAWTLPVLALGGDGVVSVASNEIPGEMVALCAAARAGDWESARSHHERWLPLFLANFRGGPNPVPAKAALVLMGLLDGDAVRAPLLPLDDEPRAALAAVLRASGLVEPAGGRFAGDRREAIA